MLIISFDCAVKTLGVAVVEYNDNWYNEIQILIRDKSLDKKVLLEKINEKVDNINIIILETVCIANTKDILQKRLLGLKNYVNKLNERINEYLKINNKILNIEKTIVLIEKQNPSNPISVSISHCLLYEYSTYKSVLQGASVKNKVELDPEKSYGYFIEKYSNTYTSNKKHSINNFEYYMKIFKKEDLVKDIKKKDDVADAFNQILGYLYFKSKNK